MDPVYALIGRGQSKSSSTPSSDPTASTLPVPGENCTALMAEGRGRTTVLDISAVSGQ